MGRSGANPIHASDDGLDALSPLPPWCEPSSPDLASDPVVKSTDRSLWRLALVAAATGARFEREGSPTDPAEWLAEPRRLFGGRSAFHACRDRNHFITALMMHSLLIDPDAGPDAVARLIGGEGGRGGDVTTRAARHRRPALSLVTGDRARTALALWCATMVVEDEEGTLQVFWGMIAADDREVLAKIGTRYGSRGAFEARIAPGFDWSEPLACALVSEALADTLMLAAAEPDSDFAAGLDVCVEQRFRS